MNDSTITTKSMGEGHYCQQAGCAKWGGFGFDRNDGRQKTTDWWCWEHYPYKDPFQLHRDTRKQ